MTIEIQKPELEALILERMQLGAFATVEDALMEALESSLLPSERVAGSSQTVSSTGAVVLAALQSSPYPDIDLAPPRMRLSNVREVIL
jgi:hypothetical protein